MDLIEGLSPAISIEQKAAGHNPRSTVGTITEIHDYLRLLYARVGTPDHGLPLQAQREPDGGRRDGLAGRHPAGCWRRSRGKKGSFEDECASLQAQGYAPAVDGQLLEIDGMAPLKKSEKHDIDVVIDRLRIKPESKQRLAESFETASAGRGRALALDMDSSREQVFSSRYAARSAATACRNWSRGCSASTTRWAPAPAATASDRSDSSTPSAWSPSRAEPGRRRDPRLGPPQRLHPLAAHQPGAHYEFEIEAPFEELPEDVRQKVLYGSGDEEISFVYLNERAAARSSATPSKA